jgi:hypothetical protein
MTRTSLTLAALAASLAALATPLPATAGEARASGNANVYEYPRSSADIIDHLEDGEYYEVLECTRQARFCLVADDDGYELGWVRGSYLVGSGAKVEVTPFEFLVKPPFPFLNP